MGLGPPLVDDEAENHKAKPTWIAAGVPHHTGGLFPRTKHVARLTRPSFSKKASITLDAA